MEAITTDIFTVPASRAARRRGSALAEKWWWAIAIPLIVLAVAACYDFRYAIVAFALVLVVVPGILAIAYFQCALTLDAALATVPHTIVFGSDSLTINYIRGEEDRPIAPRKIPYAAIASVDDTDSQYLLLRLADSSELEIPYASLPAAAIPALLTHLRG